MIEENYIEDTEGSLVRVGDILAFLKECHSEMGFSEWTLDFDNESVYKSIVSITDAGGCLFIEHDTDGISGIFAAMEAGNIMNHSQSIAIEYIWHTRPDTLRSERIAGMNSLVAKGEAWAKENKLYLIVNTSAAKGGADKILLKRGFVPREKSFGKGY